MSRRLSQALAVQISFIESGRSTPGRHNLVHLADALDVPFRERNLLLLAAGYAPLFAEGDIDDPQMQSITYALRRVLAQHEPFPAVVMDRYWNVVMTNDAAPRFFGTFIDMEARQKPRNLLHLMFDPTAMRPFIPNWEETAKSLLARVFRESVGRFIDTRTQALMDSLPRLSRRRKPLEDIDLGRQSSYNPFVVCEGRPNPKLLLLVTTVATAQTVATQELRIECMFPVDDASEEIYRTMVGKG